MRPGSILSLARNERLARSFGFWWGLAEGLLFFIVPDVYISFATLFSLRAGAMAWLFSIAGSAAAVGIIYLLVTILGLDYLAFLEEIPGISRPLIEQATRRLADEGLPYTPFLAAGGVPLKLYAALASSFGLGLGSMLLWTVFARLVRIAPTFAVVATMRLLFRNRIDTHASLWCALLGLFWFGFYVFYFLRVSGV